MLKGFKACPPLVTDIDLSVDDKYLYVSCWGTGDLQQYDVSDPFKPKLVGKLRIAASSRARRIRTGGKRSMAATDGRGQPRWQARVLHELAVRGDR